MPKREFAVGDRVRFAGDAEHADPGLTAGTVRTRGTATFITGLPQVDAYQITWDVAPPNTVPATDDNVLFHWMNLVRA